MSTLSEQLGEFFDKFAVETKKVKEGHSCKATLRTLLSESDDLQKRIEASNNEGFNKNDAISELVQYRTWLNDWLKENLPENERHRHYTPRFGL